MNRFRFALPLIAASTALGQIPEIPAGMYSREIDADLVSTVRAAMPESRAVGSEFLDPYYNPVVTLSERAAVAVTFIDEGAGFRNSLAWLALPTGALNGLTKSSLDTDASGNVSITEMLEIPGAEAGLVFPNASRNGAGGQLIAGDTLELDGGREFEAGTQILFCVLQNAWRNGEVKGYSINLESTLSMYSADMLNPEAPADADLGVDSVAERCRHVAMLFTNEQRDEIIMGFEDLHRNHNSDEDFNDAVFLVTSTPALAISETQIASADPAFNPRPADLSPNPDCCGVDTTNILATELPERTNVNAAFMDPFYVPTLIVSEDTRLMLSFVGEGAIYQNSLGFIAYETGYLDGITLDEADYNSDGVVEPWELGLFEGVEIGMVFAHSSAAGSGGALQPTESVIVGDRVFPAGTSVDFFLVQDGWNDDRTVKDFARDSGDGTLSFYTIDALNPEPEQELKRHVAMMFTDDNYNSILFGFEDLHRSERSLNPGNYRCDHDFNDNVFCVTPLTDRALSTTGVHVADPSCFYDLNDDGIVDKADYRILMRSGRRSDRLGNAIAPLDPRIAHGFLKSFGSRCR